MACFCIPHWHQFTHMLRHFFLITFRNLRKNGFYSAINITGLAVGLAGFIIVLLYLNYELSYDKWNPDMERVYRISEQTDEEIQEQTPAPLAAFLKSGVPGVEAATRVQAGDDYEVSLRAGDKSIYAKGSVDIDSNFLSVFPLELVRGDEKTALLRPSCLIISTDLATVLFGNEDPIGKVVRVYNAFDVEVTAVFKKPSTPTHFPINLAWRSPYESSNMHWGNRSFTTYIKMTGAMPVTELEGKINPVYYTGQLKKDNTSFESFRQKGHQAGLFADKVTDIHNFPAHGPTQFPTVMVLLVLAFLLLLAGSVNFSNLSIASSIRRAKEVGVRKAMGSGRGQLLRQFLGETSIQCLISLALAILLVALAVPFFTSTFELDNSLLSGANIGSLAAQVALCLLLIILLSGLYPAVFLAMLNTTKVLKGEYSTGTRGRGFRNGLIVVQFVVAAFFVFGTVVINRQVHYMETKDRGFTGEQVIRIESMQDTRDKNFESTRATLMDLPGVTMVEKTTEVPGDQYGDTSTFFFKHDGRDVRLGSVKVSTGYFELLGIPLLTGRLFDNRYSDQHTRSVVLNEMAAARLGNGDPVGKSIYFNGCDTIPVQVIGVVKDFMVQGFDQAIQPKAYTIGNDVCMFQSGGGLLLKTSSGKMAGTIAALQQQWKKIEPDVPVRYSFLDDNFARLFASQFRLQKIISIFTIAAILISLIGLFAMTAYLTGQRNKEIGVRKVLGGSVFNIASLLSRDFLLLVLGAVIIAAPLAWWATDKWLSSFAYRITPGWWMFALSALAVFAVALLTVGVQAIRAASANPIRSLRAE
ncbi:MAG: ABC transporter permease [Chitinophagaceae bacterium]|nr:MAG: ABC transporter permease [Chitinophagaceae bacterium]